MLPAATVCFDPARDRNIAAMVAGVRVDDSHLQTLIRLAALVPEFLAMPDSRLSDSSFFAAALQRDRNPGGRNVVSQVTT